MASFEDGSKNGERLSAIIKSAQEIARQNELKLGQKVAHPSDYIVYILKEIKGDTAVVWLPGQKNTAKEFPLNELFDPNVALKKALRKRSHEKPELGVEEIEKEQRKKRIIDLAKELSESRESFPFPGVNPHSYQKLKADEEEFPGYVTPIDELIHRFKREGMKVVFGNDPESGNVFILPRGSDDVENDSIFPKHLQVVEGMDRRLKELILLYRD
ncbi:MAG: hypothetical protein WC608_03780 [Parcubacteria group bacterium]